MKTSDALAGIPATEWELLNQKMKASAPYDKGLAMYQEEVWRLADKYGFKEKEIVTAFLDWKSKEKGV